MNEELLPTLQRYIDKYEWGWPLTRRLINRTFHFDYTVEQLQALYLQKEEPLTAETGPSSQQGQ